MSANSDNPAGMSTRWLRQRVNELSASLADMTQTVWELSQTVSQLSENLENTSTLAADNADRIHALELSVWRYHERPGLMARLVAIGYDETEAAEIVDTLVATGIDTAEQGVALREQLATLRYTPTEIEECIEDVPGISQADIDYAKEILDAWDPATTSLADAYRDNKQLVIFPKLDTSNVTNLNNTFRGCTNLRYVPWLDTSRVTTVTFSFGWSGGYTALHRLPDLKWPSLKRGYGPYTGLRSLSMMPAEPFDLSAATFLSCTFGYSRIPASFPGVRFNTAAPVQLDQFFVETIIDGELPITEFPESITRLWGIYANSRLTNRDLSNVTIRALGVTEGPQRIFMNVNLTHAPQFDMPGANSFEHMFQWCDYLIQVPDYTGMSPLTMSGMFESNAYGSLGHPLARVEGLNFARVTDATLFGTDNSTSRRKPNLRYLRITNLGQSELTSYDFSLATVWGTGSEEARQSLVNSLLTDSYDRAAAGMTPATVRLSAASKAALTAEEIAAITAKGFTIA